MSAFLAAVQLLTVIPVRVGEPKAPAWSAMFFPVVGAILGGVAAAIYRLLSPWAPRGLLALLILALWALLTGGLHEDGLADTFDAFGGGRSREDILRILKDSRIGSFGALALIFSVVIRWQALALIPEAQVRHALLASQVLPRAGMVAMGVLAGGATAGLGGAWASTLKGWHAVAAAALALAITWNALPAAVLCFVLVVLMSGYFRRRIGGITGDCLGAANQIQEIVILVLAACS